SAECLDTIFCAASTLSMRCFPSRSAFAVAAIAVMLMLLVSIASCKPKPSAWVTAGELFVRDMPSRQGKEVTLLKFGTEVKVLDEVEPTETISGKTSKWMKISAGEKEGFAFGGFLTRDKSFIEGAEKCKSGGNVWMNGMCLSQQFAKLMSHNVI